MPAQLTALSLPLALLQGETLNLSHLRLATGRSWAKILRHAVLSRGWEQGWMFSTLGKALLGFHDLLRRQGFT